MTTEAGPGGNVYRGRDDRFPRGTVSRAEVSWRLYPASALVWDIIRQVQGVSDDEGIAYYQEIMRRVTENPDPSREDKVAAAAAAMIVLHHDLKHKGHTQIIHDLIPG